MQIHTESPLSVQAASAASAPVPKSPQNLPSELPDWDLAAHPHFECHGHTVLGLGFVAGSKSPSPRCRPLFPVVVGCNFDSSRSFLLPLISAEAEKAVLSASFQFDYFLGNLALRAGSLTLLPTSG